MKVAELDPVNEVNTDVFDLNRVRFDDKITKIINFDNSDKEVEEFKQIVEKGAHLFFKYAREGGFEFA